MWYTAYMWMLMYFDRSCQTFIQNCATSQDTWDQVSPRASCAAIRSAIPLHVTAPYLILSQILPGRTHPTMNTSGSGGFILHAIKVYVPFALHRTVHT